MIEKHFRIAIVTCLILTLIFGLSVVELGTEEQDFNEEKEYNSISTGSMPADTMEERAEMRKMTAMVDYNTKDSDS